MKLYTESQVKDMFSGVMHGHHIDVFLEENYTPIELPTDEEIKKMALEKYRDVEYTRGDEMIQFGAKWVIKQIKKQK